MKNKNKFISLYLPIFTKEGKQEKYLSIAFTNTEEHLYKKLKSLKTSEIKDIINIHNYNALLSVAESNYLKPTLYVKQLLNRHFNSKKKIRQSASSRLDDWIKQIGNDHPLDKKYQALIKYLKEQKKESLS